MEFKDLVSWYFQRSNDMQIYWNFYVTITLALLVFFGSAKTPRPKVIAIVLSLAFVMFAAVNLDGLIDVTRQRNTLAHLAGSLPATLMSGDEHTLAATLTPPGLPSVVVVHLFGDILVLAGIWYFVLKRSAMREQA